MSDYEFTVDIDIKTGPGLELIKEYAEKLRACEDELRAVRVDRDLARRELRSLTARIKGIAEGLRE